MIILLLLLFLCSFSALLLLAAAYCLQTSHLFLHYAFVLLSVAVICVDHYGHWNREIIKEIASTLSVIMIIAVCLVFTQSHRVNLFGLVGSLCFAIAGLVIPTEGRGPLEMKNMDWFHYTLSVGTCFLGMGIA